VEHCPLRDLQCAVLGITLCSRKLIFHGSSPAWDMPVLWHYEVLKVKIYNQSWTSLESILHNIIIIIIISVCWLEIDHSFISENLWNGYVIWEEWNSLISKWCYE
jgi:hypothetical protein